MTPHRITLRRTVVGIVALGMAATLAPAAAQTDDDRVTVADNIEDARAERDEARRQQLIAATTLSLLEAEDEDIKAALDAANELVASQQARVDAARTRLDLAELDRYRAETDLAWASQDIEVLRAAARFFAVESYVRLPANGSNFLIESGDPNRSARRAALLGSIGRSAIDALDDLRAAEEDRAGLAVVAADAATRAAELEAELTDRLVVLEEAQATQASIAAEMDARIAHWEQELAGFEQDERDLTELIRRKQLEAAGIGGPSQPGIESSEGFVWPTAGKVGSGFGPRLHPILGYTRMHNGLDIGGAQGQPIWASKAGTVLIAGWQGGYGNAVVVGHEGGLTTLYAHMSQISVSVGTQLDTGDFVGQVGSTGLSTGPHLHFEMRVNGNLVDPRPFLA
jgi:murein DD-endopeptidase MepM/ murein hydrolase activator NlpD